MYQNDPTKVLTGEIRASYEHLLKPYVSPKASPGTEPTYSVTALIPKSDTDTVANIFASIEAAINLGMSTVWGGIRPPKMGTSIYPPAEFPKNDIPVYDGDGQRKEGDYFGPECHGCWVLTASSRRKPGVVSMDNINQELAPSDVYSGMYGRLTIRFYPYSNRAKGVGCGLGNFMKTRDGEPLAGGPPASADFAGIGNSIALPPNPGIAQFNPFAPPPTNFNPNDYPF